MLCVGNYWSEAEGKAFLEQMRQTYATAETLEKSAKQIRTQIRKGIGLEKYPKKCPFHPIIGEKRVSHCSTARIKPCWDWHERSRSRLLSGINLRVSAPYGLSYEIFRLYQTIKKNRV